MKNVMKKKKKKIDIVEKWFEDLEKGIIKRIEICPVLKVIKITR